MVFCGSCDQAGAASLSQSMSASDLRVQDLACVLSPFIYQASRPWHEGDKVTPSAKDPMILPRPSLGPPSWTPTTATPSRSRSLGLPHPSDGASCTLSPATLPHHVMHTPNARAYLAHHEGAILLGHEQHHLRVARATLMRWHCSCTH